MNDGNSSGIRIVAVLGTARPENYTSKALALVIDEIGKHENIALDLIDPAAQDQFIQKGKHNASFPYQ